MSTPNTNKPAAYKVEDRELLLHFYKRLFWDRLVEVIPAWVAPNAITLAGQVCGIFAAVTAWAATGGMPALYLVSGVLLLAYLTADNVDGAHARRTGQCSPLGEFLDHGLDGIASGAILLTAAFILRIDGIWMALLMVMGAIGFMLTFWEQYRTGFLVIPAASQIEGLSLVVLLEVVIFAADEPATLLFTPGVFNTCMALLVALIIGYTVAVVTPLVRVKRKGVPIGELAPLMLIAFSACGYVSAGAGALLPSIMVCLFAADAVARFILLRHRGQDASVVSPLHWTLLAPLVPAALGVWTPDGWAGLAFGISLFTFGRTMLRGGAEILGLSAYRPA